MVDWLKSKKAMSPILALLIVLGVTIVVGAVFYAWGSGMFESSQEKTKSAMEGQAATMSNDVIPYYVRVGVVGHDESPATFEYVSTGVDADNDKTIKYGEPYKPDKYTKCLKDERVIFEIPIYIRNNAQDKTLKGVTAKVLGLSGHLWWALHLKYDEANDQYVLLKGDDSTFTGYIGYASADENNAGFTYVFTTSSYAVNISSSASGYKWNGTDLISTTGEDIEYSTIKAKSLFADYTSSPLKLISADGTNYYLVAINSSGDKWYMATSKAFFRGTEGYNDCKLLFNNPTYNIGDIPPNSVKVANTYIAFGYITSEYLPDIDEISIRIQDSEGTLTKTIPLKFHIEDPEWS